MKFLLDQDVYFKTFELLEDMGHDAVTASTLHLSQASDEEILLKAKELDRIVITRDRDYGSLVFLKKIGTGVIYLRTFPSTLDAVHTILKEVLSRYNQEELMNGFVVIEPAGYRYRKKTNGI